jgi:hypothetical protein
MVASAKVMVAPIIPERRRLRDCVARKRRRRLGGIEAPFARAEVRKSFSQRCQRTGQQPNIGESINVPSLSLVRRLSARKRHCC